MSNRPAVCPSVQNMLERPDVAEKTRQASRSIMKQAQNATPCPCQPAQNTPFDPLPPCPPSAQPARNTVSSSKGSAVSGPRFRGKVRRAGGVGVCGMKVNGLPVSTGGRQAEGSKGGVSDTLLTLGGRMGRCRWAPGSFGVVVWTIGQAGGGQGGCSNWFNQFLHKVTASRDNVR